MYAAGRGMYAHLEGILTIMRSLAMKKPPDERLRTTSNPFYAQCMTQLVNFASVDVKVDSQPGKLTFAKKSGKLFGIKALEWQYTQCADLKAKGGLTLDNIELLKIYTWALTEKQTEQVEEWKRSLLLQRVQTMKALKSSSEKDEDSVACKGGVAQAKKKIKTKSDCQLPAASAASAAS